MPVDYRQKLLFVDRALEGVRVRQRVVLCPAGVGRIDGENSLVWQQQPSFDSVPAEGAIWVRMPLGAVEISQPGEAKFENNFTGLSLTTVYPIKVNSHMLHGLPGLAKVINEYEVASAFTVTIEPGAGGLFPLPAADVVYPGYNVWIIATDDGDESLHPMDFRVEFEGVQWPLNEKKGNLYPGHGSDREYQLVHIARACMDMGRMQHACAIALRSTSYYGYDPADARAGRFVFLVDMYWEGDAPYKFCWVHVEKGLCARLWPITVLWDSMRHLAGNIYKGLLRFGAPQHSLRFLDATTGAGHPYGHITMKRSAYTSTMTAGADLPWSNAYIIGGLQFRNGDGSTYVGGLFVPSKDGADTYATNTSVWQFLGDCCNGTLAKAKIHQVSATTVEVRFLKPLESITQRVVSLSDGIVYNDHDAMRGFPVTESAGTIAGATWSIKEAFGNDTKEAGKQPFGQEKEREAIGTLPFDNSPVAAELNDWHLETIRFGNGTEWIGFRHNGFPLFKVWYPDNPGIPSSESVMMRAHHAATIKTGMEQITTTHSSTLELPRSIPVAGRKFNQLDITLSNILTFVYDVRATLAVVMAEGTLMNGMVDVSLLLFGDKKQATYNLTLSMSIADFNALGDEFDLGPPDVNGFYTAQALVGTTDSDESSLYGRCFLVAVKPNPNTRTSECQLMGVRK